MTWFWTAAGVVAAAGLGLGLFFAARSPTFVSGLAAVIGKAIWKAVVPALLRRKSPEEEAKDRQKVREGGRRKDGGR